MRGHDEQTHHRFSYLSPEQRVPADHPRRAVRALTDHALKMMSRRLASLYATTGRPSIPPEQLLRALVLQVLYTVRKRKLVEQVFGWMKAVGGLRKLRHRGIALVEWQLTFAAATYNLVRLWNLEATSP